MEETRGIPTTDPSKLRPAGTILRWLALSSQGLARPLSRFVLQNQPIPFRALRRSCSLVQVSKTRHGINHVCTTISPHGIAHHITSHPHNGKWNIYRMNKNDGDKIVQLKAFPVPGYFAADLPQPNDGFTPPVLMVRSTSRLQCLDKLPRHPTVPSYGFL